ncbi:C40 family peptidase [Pseudomonas sp. LjRoot277]|uniref:C40 family peptidase n=1 Tax=Pseudomonas sp. LjRoot277 TaxID=3342307 RepID=UPI003ECFD2CC
MSEVFNKCRTDAEAHARAEYPRESVGLVVSVRGKPSYVLCRNQSEEPDHFILHPEDYVAAEDLGDIVAVVHSHPDAGPEPSLHDIASHAVGRMAWWIVGLKDGAATWQEMPAAGEMPLEGRVFVHGVIDCYTLIRDYYRQERGVTLMDFYRKDDWWHSGENLYVENFTKAGFVEVDTPSNGDVILMAIGSPTPCHGAIWLDGDVLLHHLYSRLSCREVYGAAYRERTTHILRYIGTGARHETN